MAKKSFLDDNPALAYISTYREAEDTDSMINTDNTEHTDNTDSTEHAHIAPKKKEIKNRRVNLIMAPSLHSDLTILAHMQRVSLNELVSRVMGEYVTQRQEQLQKYLTIVGD